MGKNKIGRNDLCTCESGLKYKKCHGDPVKIMQSKQAYHDRFNGLVEAEKAKAKVPPEFNELHGDPSGI